MAKVLTSHLFILTDTYLLSYLFTKAEYSHHRQCQRKTYKKNTLLGSNLCWEVPLLSIRSISLQSVCAKLGSDQILPLSRQPGAFSPWQAGSGAQIFPKPHCPARHGPKSSSRMQGTSLLRGYRRQSMCKACEEEPKGVTEQSRVTHPSCNPSEKAASAWTGSLNALINEICN